ncbi:MAG: glycosyltransferase family 2 protein [Candidatus Kapaibacterium sp.]
MLRNKTVAVVVPCYNEEQQIGIVIDTMPDFVDRIIIVNDKSKDNTAKVVESYIEKYKYSGSPLPNVKNKLKKTRFNRAEFVLEEQSKTEISYFTDFEVAGDDESVDTSKIILINHLQNGGVGAAIATGYKWAKDNNIDCTAVMAGDGQMDPDELEELCLPVVEEGVDYVKGNRLIHRSALLVIPKVRYFGNSVLSILTKIASGYWHVSDTQTGYTAISNRALNAIRLHDIFKRYGMPNDMLVKLNIAMCSLKEVEIKPVYDVGEKSKMKIHKVIPTISWLLLKLFFKRLWFKYLFRDFHPLFLLYHFTFLIVMINIPLGLNIAYSYFIEGVSVSPQSLIAFLFFFISGFQSLLFAMWMDIQDNERLYKS